MMRKGVVVGVVFLAALLIGVGVFLISYLPDKDLMIKNETGVVARGIDLDTLELVNGGRVRLLCVNAPERAQSWTARAESELAALVEGKTVVLMHDVSDTDDYGRLLRHVYREDNNIWVQEFLVRNGFARIEVYAPDTTRCGALENARAQAASESLGIWTAKIPVCDRDIYDCDDFASSEQATALFAACGGTRNDIHQLDGDSDGVICEELMTKDSQGPLDT